MVGEMNMGTKKKRIDFGDCPKCGESEPTAFYETGAPFMWEGKPRYCDGVMGEHFHLKCRRCSFGWLENRENSD